MVVNPGLGVRAPVAQKALSRLLAELRLLKRALREVVNLLAVERAPHRSARPSPIFYSTYGFVFLHLCAAENELRKSGDSL